MPDTPTTLRPPSPWLLLLEARAPWEYAATLALWPWLNAARGDGHPVLVFPGLGASALSTAPMRRLLNQQGYAAYDWELGRNRPRPGLLEACAARVETLAARHGRKVSLVGWSLGGVYARELAKRLPDQTRCVITLGTPFSGSLQATDVARAYRLLGHPAPRPDAARMARLRQAPTVPTSSIYSRSDGVVAWQCSLNDAQPHTENIEVLASHLGLGLNPMALYALADRLRQDPVRWQRFVPPTESRWLFRGKPASIDKAWSA